MTAGGNSLPSALTGGYHLAYLVGATCVGLGILAAFLILRPPAATVPRVTEDSENELAGATHQRVAQPA